MALLLILLSTEQLANFMVREVIRPRDGAFHAFAKIAHAGMKLPA